MLNEEPRGKPRGIFVGEEVPIRGFDNPKKIKFMKKLQLFQNYSL